MIKLALKFSIIIPLLASTGCSERTYSRCLSSNKLVVQVISNIPSALDGYDYKVCTLQGNTCSKDNFLNSLRPDGLDIRIVDNAVYIQQNGGSVAGYATDPIGMIDRDYHHSHPIYLSVINDKSKALGVHVFLNDKEAALVDC